MASHLGRRKFLATLGGAATAWPLAARAQQPERKRRVVFLHSSAENDPEVQARIAAFRQGLETLGWVENRNVQIEHRFSDGDFAQIQPHTAELVSSAPDLIVGSGTAVIRNSEYLEASRAARRLISAPAGSANTEPIRLAAFIRRPPAFGPKCHRVCGSLLPLLRELDPELKRVSCLQRLTNGRQDRNPVKTLASRASPLAKRPAKRRISSAIRSSDVRTPLLPSPWRSEICC
jgi:hypothetical protein